MDYKAVAEWALSDDVGMSSLCIARTMMGIETDGDHPYDGGDFRRCEKLLEHIPEFRERLPEMAKVSPVWSALVDRWDEIAQADKKAQYKLISGIIAQARAQHGGEEYTL